MKKVFRFIHTERVNYPVALLARVLKVNRSAYYAWAGRPMSAHEVEDRDLTRLIKEIHAANRRVYGTPRIHAELRIGIRTLLLGASSRYWASLRGSEHGCAEVARQAAGGR